LVSSGHAVTVIGLGYVGLPLAVAAAKAGNCVIGYDIAEHLVDDLASGQSPIEDVSELSLKEAMAAGNLRFTTDSGELADCRSYVICVPTPLVDKTPDLSMVMAAVDAVAANLSPGNLVVLESTTYPGTTEDLIAPRLAQKSGLEAGADYHLAFSPERIDPGNRVYGITNTPKIVGGVGVAATQAAVELYESFIERVHPVSSPREAEMAKLLENTFRHVNIALVNEMAVFCQELGVDLWEAIEAAATKPFGFMAFKPGPGVGGHCIPIDPSYLSWHVRRLGYSFRFVELACEINDRMPEYVADRAGELLNRERKAINGSRILLLGVAYKADVSDVRETPAVVVARRLTGRGAALSWHDPYVERCESLETMARRVYELSPRVLRAFDLAIIHTDHTTYDWPSIIENSALVLDTRNVTAAFRKSGIARL
jgi:UDP-N-acetyl-D-glucosamine dehydrogenase